jgi:hypothetical protein
MRRGAARLDHVFPLSRGGADRVSNLALCCGKCDQAKQDRTPGELLLWALRIWIAAVVASVKGVWAESWERVAGGINEEAISLVTELNSEGTRGQP